MPSEISQSESAARSILCWARAARYVPANAPAKPPITSLIRIAGSKLSAAINTMVEPSAAYKIPWRGYVEFGEDRRSNHNSRQTARQHVAKYAEVYLLAKELHRHHQQLHGDAKCERGSHCVGRSDV